MTLPINTERLIVRRFILDDVSDILAFLSHPSVTRIVQEIEATEAGVRKYIQTQNSHEPFEQDIWFSLPVSRKGDGRVIGLVSLVCKDHRKGQIGWSLGVEHRGQGYATEAASGLLSYGFGAVGLHRISADTSSGIPASWRLMERLGMRREANLREAEFREGEWIDYYIYGILADEWKNREMGY
jgi:RimJ/RimL family protein N-acetyltransferase